MENDQIGLQGFYFNFFDEDKEWVSREGLSDYPCLSILMEIWPGYWKNYLKNMYMAVYQDNSNAAGMVNGQY